MFLEAAFTLALLALPICEDDDVRILPVYTNASVTGFSFGHLERGELGILGEDEYVIVCGEGDLVVVELEAAEKARLELRAFVDGKEVGSARRTKAGKILHFIATESGPHRLKIRNARWVPQGYRLSVTALGIGDAERLEDGPSIGDGEAESGQAGRPGQWSDSGKLRRSAIMMYSPSPGDGEEEKGRARRVDDGPGRARLDRAGVRVNSGPASS